MEIGYLWLTLSLFLFLMTTGAAIAIAAVAFPLVRDADEEHFVDAFHLFKKRRMWSYGVLTMLSLANMVLLLIYPMYSLPVWTRDWMYLFVCLLVGITIVSSVSTRSLKRIGYDARHMKIFGRSLWSYAFVWFAGSCVLIWSLVKVVGLDN